MVSHVSALRRLVHFLKSVPHSFSLSFCFALQNAWQARHLAAQGGHQMQCHIQSRYSVYELFCFLCGKRSITLNKHEVGLILIQLCCLHTEKHLCSLCCNIWLPSFSYKAMLPTITCATPGFRPSNPG